MPGKKKGSKKNGEKTCTYHEGKLCDRVSYDGEYCIFHSKDIEGKKDKFICDLKNELKSQKEKGSPFDFTGFVFPANFSFKGIANLQYANFQDAKLSGINFEGANLTGANFTLAYLWGTNFSKTNLQDASFLGGTNLLQAHFVEANLQRAQFIGANLNHANLKKAMLRKANLQHANFHEADLRLADLQGADLTKADLTKAYLNSADLRGANLRGANFEECDIKDIKYDRSSRYMGIRLSNCCGSPLFVRFAKDQEYLEDFSVKHPKTYKVWLIFADCGRSFLRWAAWSIGIALLFAVIFTPPRDLLPDFLGVDWLVPDCWIDLCNKIGPQFEQTSKAYSGEPIGFWSSLYFSIVTFTTLGFGDIVAANLSARVLVTIEVILGYIMLGFLISIGANKISRRS